MAVRHDKGRIVEMNGLGGRIELDSGASVGFEAGPEANQWRAGWRVHVALDHDRVQRVKLDITGLGLTVLEAMDAAKLRAHYDKLVAVAPLDETQIALFEAALAIDVVSSMTKGARLLRSLLEQSRRGDSVPLDDGDPWAVAARDELSAIPEREAWLRVLGASGDGSKPTKKFIETTAAAIERIGTKTFIETVQRWFALVAPRPVVRDETNWFTPAMTDANSAALRNLVWACGTITGERESEIVAVAIGNLAVRCFTKIRGVGALSTKAGNACIYVLSQLPGLRAVSQLSRLGARVRYTKALELIEKAKLECAKRAGMEPIDLEELALPTFGLDVTGRARTQLGAFTAELAIVGDDAVLGFFDGAKRLKSVPAAVKSEHAEELKELKTTHKELEALVPTLKYRLERWLVEPRAWRLEDLHQRYLDHPLAAPLARRLIYTTAKTSMMFVDGYPIDVTGKRLELSDDTPLALWHPLGQPETELAGWRALLESLGLTQPIKQLDRELYVATQNELTHKATGRFANRTLRQHQLAALCRERGWTYRLHGQFDGGSSPTKYLPAYDLEVRFAIDRAEDATTSEAGIFIHVRSGTVSFHKQGGAITLAQVPARCFSETLRDVDLFVATAPVT